MVERPGEGIADAARESLIGKIVIVSAGDGPSAALGIPGNESVVIVDHGALSVGKTEGDPVIVPLKISKGGIEGVAASVERNEAEGGTAGITDDCAIFSEQR